MTRTTRAGFQWGRPRPGRRGGARTAHTALCSVLAGVCALTLAACSGDDPDPGDTRGASVTSGPDGTASPSADPVALLGAYHLTLPEGAENVAVQEKPHEDYPQRHVVTFTAPLAQVEAVCEAAGLPSTPAAALRADQVDLLGTSTPPAQARICQGSDPEDPARQRAVLFVGDPAQVWVMLWQRPAR